MKNEYFDLLKLWADNLMEYQIKDEKHKEFDGGILCPACHDIPGRIGDSMYPFVYLYAKTGDEKYYNCARLLFKWTKNNVMREKGQMINDSHSTWYGITEFFNISLGVLLYELKEYIRKDDYAEWFELYKDTTEYIYDNFFDNPEWNVNYRIATATCMAIAWRILGDDKYLKNAHKFAKISMEHITDEGLLYGEGKPTDRPTPGGDLNVDLGYNAEESLPNLATYLKYIDEDKEMEDVLVKAMQTHLEFMLPDGAWDNTWGSRNAKWTYWGSRTSDGCFDAYEHMAEYDEAFFEAAHRNYELLKKCTVDGLLAGGLHHKEMDEPCCIHHTFCHMKSLVALAETKNKRNEGVKLFRETFDGIKKYETLRLHNAVRGDFIATYAAADLSPMVISGGSVSMLYHKKAGIILAAGQDEYFLVEAHNMQVPKLFLDICQNPRIELEEKGQKRRNTYDRRANIQVFDDGQTITYKADGMLRDKELNGNKKYSVTYTMTRDCFGMAVKTEAENSKLIMPVVALPDERIEASDGKVIINKPNCKVVITSTGNIVFDTKRAERFFAAQGGLSMAWIVTELDADKDVEIKISVE